MDVARWESPAAFFPWLHAQQYGRSATPSPGRRGAGDGAVSGTGLVSPSEAQGGVPDAEERGSYNSLVAPGGIRMPRHRASCGLFLLGLVCSVPAAGTEPTAYAVIHTDAGIRTAPPEVASTGKRVPYGTVVVVVDEKSVSGKDYVKVRLRDEPKTEFGWIAKSGLGSTKEFDPAMRPEDSVDDQKLTGTKALMAAIYNARGKYLKEQANALGVSPAALAAVLKVESGGRAFGPDGRVIIRFENHVFWNVWGKESKGEFDSHLKFDAKERWKGHQSARAPCDPWGACHTSQAIEWEVLNYAKTLDEGAALASASYGIGQIMGFNHKAVGYASDREMVKKFDEGIKPQLDAMIAFIKGKEKCLRGLRAKDYTLFAECYNGTGKAAEYGARIKEAADAFAEVTAGKRYADGLPAEKVTAALPGLEKYVDGLREKTGVPGLAIAVVHADKVVYLKGFGVREVGQAGRDRRGHGLPARVGLEAADRDRDRRPRRRRDRDVGLEDVGPRPRLPPVRATTCRARSRSATCSATAPGCPSTPATCSKTWAIPGPRCCTGCGSRSRPGRSGRATPTPTSASRRPASRRRRPRARPGKTWPPTGSSSRSAWTARATATPTTRPPPTGRGSTSAATASGSRSTTASPTPRPRPAARVPPPATSPSGCACSSPTASSTASR